MKSVLPPNCSFFYSRELFDENTNYILFPYYGKSMSGTFKKGDILLVKQVMWDTVHPGDVIVFYSPQPERESVIFVHRVQSRLGMKIVTCGDRNSTPDKPVEPKNLVGRVWFLLRDGKTHHVHGGWIGQLWSYSLRLWHQFTTSISWIYNLLKERGLLHTFWKPCITLIEFTTEDGFLVKYMYRGHTIAHWWPQQQRFWCRRPYDLFISHPGNQTQGIK